MRENDSNGNDGTRFHCIYIFTKAYYMKISGTSIQYTFITDLPTEKKERTSMYTLTWKAGFHTPVTHYDANRFSCVSPS
jgi:hypothetical protein